LGITESNFTEVNINLLATNPDEIADPATGALIAPFDGVLDLDLPRLAPLSASAVSDVSACVSAFGLG